MQLGTFNYRQLLKYTNCKNLSEIERYLSTNCYELIAFNGGVA